jgi:hypothetical protein
MNKLDKLKAENKRLKAKGKRGTKYSSSSEDGDSFLKRKSPTRGGKEERSTISLLTILFFNYNNMPNFTSHTSIPIGKAFHLDGSNYNQWK